MKLYISAILAVVGSASATLIYPSTGTGCSNNVGTIKSCGKTGLSNYNIRSARVNFEKATATFYHDAGCKGVKLSVASDKCIQFTQWSPNRQEAVKQLKSKKQQTLIIVNDYGFISYYGSTQ
ncbi:hypothetical protein B0H34DRAFT_679723 [Crassisporium funariophilum]|nr:hypothetical protein B0H34DRAFT_679723 [Crassisporium funariophilum]